MKRVFIVGGCGFVGSHLVKRLIAERVEVAVYDNLSSGKLEWLPQDPCATAYFYNGHAQDGDRLRVVMEEAKPDTVFHLAANPDIARAVTEPTIDFDQGTVLTKNVLEAMRENGVKRLVYFSGSGVYGDCGTTPLRESHPCAPVSTYGASKLASEAMIQAYCAMFGLTARIFRPANIVGPRQTHGVGYDFLRKLKADPTRLQILGNGRQSKSYIHVDDVVSAVLRGLADPRNCAVYNLATDDYLTVYEIAVMAADLVCGEMAPCDFQYTGGDRGWLGDVPVVRFDCRAIRALGWLPGRNSAQAMRDALTAMWEELKS
jgi:UDP-glucose 4-epimerase